MKNFFVFASSLLIGLSLLSSCNNASDSKEKTASEVKPAFDLTTARKEIEAANKNFMDLVAKGDTVGLANAYTVDAKFMMPGGPAAVGRENIQKAMAGIVMSGITKVDIRMKDVFGNEDMIAEEGELSIYVKDAVVAEEKYIVLWKKEDGKWKLFRDIYNTNLPMPNSK